MPDLDLPFDSLITIRYDRDAQCPIYDIGDLDPWSAVTLIRAVALHLEDGLPLPRDINDPPDDDEEDSDED